MSNGGVPPPTWALHRASTAPAPASSQEREACKGLLEPASASSVRQPRRPSPSPSPGAEPPSAPSWSGLIQNTLAVVSPHPSQHNSCSRQAGLCRKAPPPTGPPPAMETGPDGGKARGQHRQGANMEDPHQDTWTHSPPTHAHPASPSPEANSNTQNETEGASFLEAPGRNGGGHKVCPEVPQEPHETLSSCACRQAGGGRGQPLLLQGKSQQSPEQEALLPGGCRARAEDTGNPAALGGGHRVSPPRCPPSTPLTTPDAAQDAKAEGSRRGEKGEPQLPGSR